MDSMQFKDNYCVTGVFLIALLSFILKNTDVNSNSTIGTAVKYMAILILYIVEIIPNTNGIRNIITSIINIKTE